MSARQWTGIMVTPVFVIIQEQYRNLLSTTTEPEFRVSTLSRLGEGGAGGGGREVTRGRHVAFVALAFSRSRRFRRPPRRNARANLRRAPRGSSEIVIDRAKSHPTTLLPTHGREPAFFVRHRISQSRRTFGVGVAPVSREDT